MLIRLICFNWKMIKFMWRLLRDCCGVIWPRKHDEHYDKLYTNQTRLSFLPYNTGLLKTNPVSKSHFWNWTTKPTKNQSTCLCEKRRVNWTTKNYAPAFCISNGIGRSVSETGFLTGICVQSANIILSLTVYTFLLYVCEI